MEHRSDFVRVRAVADFGGTYIDFDVHALHDIGSLRRSGFRAVVGRQAEGGVNSGVFMSAKNSALISLWVEGMHAAYTGGWTIHSNDVLTRISEQLATVPDEVLVLEQPAFNPGSWYEQDQMDLWLNREDAPSNLNDNFAEGDPLLDYATAPVLDRWKADDKDDPDRPSWAWSWSQSYVLHAFSPRFVSDRKVFPKVTPRYVLERRSNFARAVYPVAKLMYEQGLISLNDTLSGL
ncbi:unnamed protein product [Parascedosporium putredinis]|uniref:Uncharacterized protein n=1 Tax=Parascedosporium putredinis TaxID=1442378 RepID=A0A9P1H9A9_9PEZI|nr:unnamed protein product [Parascedosporium putredinis]CAI8000714.1 unnamed protein product [Parascedosporium putredinis]